MAKRKSTGYMTAGEQVAGTVLFVIYLLVLPFAADPLFRMAERLLAADIPGRVRNAIYYYTLLIVTVLIFHRFLALTSQRLGEHIGDACKGALGGLIALYGLNELAFRLFRVFLGSQTNLNDMTISAQVRDAPQTMWLIIVFVAPFVEEALFRGLVFGNLKEYNRYFAYLLSAGLFAFLHVWQFVTVNQSALGLAIVVQYLIPGLVLAGAYEYAGTLWAPFAVHAAANALVVWTVWR